MKYSLRYYNTGKQHLKNADEIIIKYDRQDVALLDFLEEYKDKRIILDVVNAKEFDVHHEYKKLNAIKQQYPEYNVQVCFGTDAPIDEAAKIGELLEYPWFSHRHIGDWDTLNYYLSKGVAQVYITEALGFDMAAVASLCYKHRAEVRVYPHVAQSCVREAPAIKKFFIRPDDMPYYEQYIDVVEFWCDYEQQPIYQRIYTNEKWYGPLREIIKDFDSDFDNKHIIPVFGQTRANCGKKCMRGSHCSICDKVYDISLALKETNLIVQKKNDRGV